MMNLNTDHLKRCIQTLRSSLTFFEQAAPESIDQEIYRNAIVCAHRSLFLSRPRRKA